MIKSAELKNLLQTMMKLQKEEQEWLDLVPIEIRSVFHENSFVNKICIEHDHILKFALGDLYEDVQWFLYEWRPGFQLAVDYKSYEINNIDDFFNYLETEHLVEI